MARGDMAVETATYGTGAEILNRPNYKAVAMTIDFAGVTGTDDLGRKVVKAGTPIDKDGKPVTATPWTGAVGILLLDVIEERPQGAILTEAYVHVTPRPIWRSVLLQRLVLARISSVLPRTLRLPVSMLSTTPFTRWQRTRLVMVQASQDC